MIENNTILFNKYVCIKILIGNDIKDDNNIPYHNASIEYINNIER